MISNKAPETQIRYVAALLCCAAAVVYANSFGGPFFFDDLASIEQNQTIRQLWPLSTVLSPPGGGLTVSGRPLLNLTFAINYLISGSAVWSYHLFNLLIHMAAGLTLFGVVRRTLVKLPVRGGKWTGILRENALAIAGSTALLFVVHPLQTESVTYMVQRAESLVSLLYLLTLYTFIRSVDEPEKKFWQILSVLACLLGMASKEVMATAPLLILLYDRTFVSGTFGGALRSRGRFYSALAATWILLLLLFLGGARGTTAGFGTSLSSGKYLVAQSFALLLYLVLAIWPHPLIVDYGSAIAPSVASMAGPIAIIGGLLLFSTFALKRWPKFGFVAFSGFLILSPSSSFIPIQTQTIAEHRMYLALSCLLFLGVALWYRMLGARAVWICAVWGVVLGAVTIRRNQDYRSERNLWELTTKIAPSNARAHQNYARLLSAGGDDLKALDQLLQAVGLDSTFVVAQNDLGRMLGRTRNFAEADKHFLMALRYNPDFLEARFNHATMLIALGDLNGGLAEFLEVERRDPKFPNLHETLGRVYVGSQQYSKAEEEFRIIVKAHPDSVTFAAALGSLMIFNNKLPEAVAQLESVVQRAPLSVGVRSELAKAYARLGRLKDAEAEYDKALKIDPTFVEAVEGKKLLKAGRKP